MNSKKTMPAPTSALVLAAGFGTRLRPLTDDVPKPLLPLWDRPSIEHVLAMLRRWGVREVTVNLHHRADALLAWARARPADGLRLNLSFEAEILGTGGALRRAAWCVGGGPLWIVNADIAAELDPRPLVRGLADPRALAALWLHPSRGPRTVETRDGWITDFRSRTPGAPGTRTFCGLQVVRPQLLDFVPEGFSTLVAAYEAAQRAGWRLAGVESPRCYWADLGTPAQYVDAHREILAAYRRGAPGAALMSEAAFRRMGALPGGGVRVSGFAAVAADARVEAGATLEDAVVGPGAHVARGTTVRGAAVGAGARVRGTVAYLAVPAATVLTPEEARAYAAAGGDPAGDGAVLLAPRGSDRSFVRLCGRGGSVMLVRWGGVRPDNERYAGHARLLAAAGVRVPAVRAEDAARRFLLMEDLGDVTLRDAIGGRPPARVRRRYEQVLDAVARLHVEGARAVRRRRTGLEPPFDAALYGYERGLFTGHFLAQYLGKDAAFCRAAERELRGVARRLAAAPRVLLHRDLQASNILMTAGGPGFIDFQGMRWGPAMYDLASLLCDPYVELPERLRGPLLACYVKKVGAAVAAPELFWPAAIQRLCQALGAYARLGALPGAARFHAHIPAALRRLRQAIARSGMRMPALESVAG